jgi:hypothetical protein
LASTVDALNIAFTLAIFVSVFKFSTKMRLVQGLVFAILTEKNCLFLFRTETDKVIKMQNHSLAATSFPLPKGAP